MEASVVLRDLLAGMPEHQIQRQRPDHFRFRIETDRGASILQEIPKPDRPMECVNDTGDIRRRGTQAAERSEPVMKAIEVIVGSEKLNLLPPDRVGGAERRPWAAIARGHIPDDRG